MATTAQTPSLASTGSPVAQQATDLLWKYQLRKEHGQLKEQLSTFITETQSTFEKLRARLSAVEKKLEKLDVDEQQLGKEGARIHGELLALKERLGQVAKIVEHPPPVPVSGASSAATSGSIEQVVGERASVLRRPAFGPPVGHRELQALEADSNALTTNNIQLAAGNALPDRRQAVRPSIGHHELHAILAGTNASIMSSIQPAVGNVLPARRQALRSAVDYHGLQSSKDATKATTTSNAETAVKNILPARRQALRSSAVTTKDNGREKDQALPSSESFPHSSSEETDDLSAPAPRPKPIPKTRSRPPKRKKPDPMNETAPELSARGRTVANSKQADSVHPPIPKLPTRSEAVARHPQASSDPTDTQNIEIPYQGASSLGDYLLMVDGLLADLPQPTSDRVESEFVKVFLDGLTNAAERQTLVRALQSQGLASLTISKSGKKDITVRWADFQEAIAFSKLLETPNAGEAEIAAEVKWRQKLQEVTNVGNVAKVAEGQQKGTRRKRRKLIPSDDEMDS